MIRCRWRGGTRRWRSSIETRRNDLISCKLPSLLARGDLYGCGGLSTTGIELRRSGGKLSHGSTRLPCRWPHLRDPRYAASGIRQSDAVTRVAASAGRRRAGSLPRDPRRLGEEGMDPHPLGRRERAADAEGPPTRMESAGREERQVEV